MRILSAISAQILILVLGLSAVRSAHAGPGVDQFEIKEPTAEPGRVELQIINDISSGNPRRSTRDGSFDDNTVTRDRHGFEFEMGLSHYVKTRIGLEFDKERQDDPDAVAEANAFAPLQLTEVGVEMVFVISRETSRAPGVGLLAEINRAIGPEASTLVIGPLFQLTRPAWSATLNLTFTRFFGSAGDEAHDDKWDFSYSAQIKSQLAKDLDLALEAYGTFDRIAGSGNPGEATILFGDHDQHRIGPIVYVTGIGSEYLRAETTFGAGVLFGLNGNTPDATFKLDVEAEF